MSAKKCIYSNKFKYLLEAMSQSSSPEDFKSFVKQKFENPDKVLEEFQSNLGAGKQNPKPEAPKEKSLNRIIESENKESLSSLYIGKQKELNDLQKTFKKKIVSSSIYNLDNKKFVSANSLSDIGNLTELNKNLVDYKFQLINKLYAEIKEEEILIDYTLDGQEFSALIESAKQLYENASEDKKEALLNTYAILSKFDSLIKSYTPFIKTKKIYEGSEYQYLDQYEYTGPNVEHFYKFSSSEFANAFEQASDLAEILLDVFQELDAKNVPIPNTSIGLQGFTSAMSSLKTALMYPPKRLQKLAKELKNGAKINMSNVLAEYINWVSRVSNVNDKRKTYLISKLRSIKKNIYDSDLNQDVKDMFTAMFFKNVPISYISYTLDPVTGLVNGENLKNSLVNIQKYRLQDVITSAIAVFRKNPDQFKLALKNNNIVDNGAGKITITTNYGEEVSINYSYDNGRYTFKTTDDLNEEVTKKIIRDLVSYVLPDDYQRISEQIDSKNTSIFKSFAPILGLIITAGNVDSKLDYNWTKASLFDFKNYHTNLDGVANTLSVLFGSDTISVIKNLKGNSVPTTQLISLAQNVPAMIDHIEDAKTKHQERTGKKRFNIYSDNIILRNRDLIGQPYIRSSILINGEIKSPSELTTTELMNIAIFSDFYNNLDKDNIEFQSTTFADKGTHYVIPFNIDKKIDINGSWVDIKELIQNCINNGDNTGLIWLYTTLRANKMENVVSNIISDWNDAFGQSFTSLDDINNYIKNNKIQEAEIKKKFKDAGIDLFDNIHYYKDSNTKQILMNETIYNWYNTFKNPQKVKARLNHQKKIFLQQLLDEDISFNRFRNASVAQVANNSNLKKWFYTNSGDMILGKTIKGENITKYNIANYSDSDIILNPLLEAYFLSDIILSNEYNSLTLGEVYAHPNKNKEGKLYKDDYFEYSEANRLIAQNKRAVIMGAIYHPFLQEMKYGVASEINVAVLNDIPATVWNMIGEEKRDLDSMDGSGISSPLQARMENVSLCDANVGYDKKTIMGDVDAIYGRPTLLKWAVYALTNARRQISQASKMSGEQLFKKMHNIPVSKEIDLVHYFNTKNKDLYYFDKETQSWRYIQGILKRKNNDGTISYIRTELVTDKHGTILDSNNVIPVEVFTKKPEDITLYDIDQLFGGAYAAELNSNKKLEYAETNLDVLMNIVAEEELKDKFIAYAVNKSAIKVGAGNINDTSRWMNDEPLDTITMSTAFGGVQMNADHDVEEAEVNEMTQMLNSLVQNGYSLGIVNNVYNDIGELVVEALSDFYNAIDTKDSAKLYRLLGEALVDAFINNDRDTIGLAQAFVMKANQSLQDNSLQYRIPFSAPTINSAFIATIISLINKSGIRRKYSGFAGVLNPSYNYIQYYRIGDSTMDYNTLAKKIYNTRADLRLNQPNNPWINAKIDDFINEAFLPDINGKVVRNPFLNRLNTIWQADFEDTIVVFDTNTKKLHTVYIDSWDKYDYLKHFLTQYGDRFIFYNWTTKPKNLKQSNTRFRVGADWYSIYDINSVRVSHYLQNNPSDEIMKLTKDIFGISDLEILPFIMGYRNQVIDKFNVDKVSKEELLKTTRKGTEDFLKALENKTAISDIYVFGDGKETFKADEYTVDPAEVIIGRKDAAKFGLEDDENISDVLAKGEEFFISKLNWQYQLPEVNSDLYDVILYTDEGEQILVKYGSEQEIQQQFAKVAGFSKNEDFQINNNKVYFKGEEFTSANDKNFYSFLDNTGRRHHLITVNTLDRIQELVNNQQVELARTNYQSKNWRKLAELNRDNLVRNPNFQYDVNLQNQDQRKFIAEESYQLNRKIKHLSKKRYDAFQKSLYLVGARIPTQGMQSYMPMKVVMLTNSKINDIYVPRVQTWLEGSDYDIDKLYIMSYNVSNGGNILTNIDSKNQRTREIALQNKVVDNILNITRNARNQINLHMPVDMNEPQKAAEDSKAGEAVKHVTADNPYVKYMMQVQNMVGKQVIGITAVSLKTFFAVSTYYNNIIDKAANDLIKLPEEIEETGLTKSPEEKYVRAASYIIYNTLKKLLIVNPLDGTWTCYSNLNFEKLIDLVDSNPVLANFQINPQSISDRIKMSYLRPFGDPAKGGQSIVPWNRYASNNYEVSTKGDKRFSALNARFKSGTIIDSIDVSGRTIEDVYQSVIKKSSKGKAPSESSKLYMPYNYKNSVPFIKQLALLGRFPVPSNNLEEIRKADKKRDDINSITKKSKSYTILRELLEFNKFADVNISQLDVSEATKNRIKEAQRRFKNTTAYNPINTVRISEDEAKIRAVEFKDMYSIYTPLIQDIVREVWGVELSTSPITFSAADLTPLGESELLQSKEEIEDFSYYVGYLPLWQEWARQNPELIEELRQKSAGKTLTDQFASTRVSQARALADILNLDKKIQPTTLSSLLHTLQDKANRVDSALVLSSLLSAATDNAKDPILSKINATSKFVGIYTYLLTIGIPFGQIADIMKSPIFNEVVKLTETNIFDKSTSRFDLKSALDFYIDETLFPGIDEKVFEKYVPAKQYTWQEITQIPGMTADILGLLQRVTPNYDQTQYNKLYITTILKKVRERQPSLADKYKLSAETHAWFMKDRIRDEQDLRAALNILYREREKGVHISAEAINQVNQEMQENPSAFKGRNLVLNPVTAVEIDSVINYLHKVAERRIFLKNLPNSEQQLSWLIKIRDNIYPAMKEMETLGAMLGINQGQKTNDQERYSYINRIEGFVNGKLGENLLSLQDFSFNEKYRQRTIAAYDTVKVTYNILDVINSVPHFSAMFRTIGLGESVLKQFSFIYDLERKTINSVKADYEENNPKKHIGIDAQMFQTIRNTLYDQTIVNWIKSLNLEIKMPKGFKYLNGTPENFAEAKDDTEPIKLDSIINIANFKKLMDESIIPAIIKQYGDSNKFVQALTRAIKEDKTTNKTKFQWRLILQMMNIAESQQTQTMYESILTDFDAIANHSINGWKIADLFYLYNLIVNKDAFGNDSFTRLFENLVLSKNSSSLISRFYQYISDLDNNKRDIQVNLQNINYRLSKLPNSKIIADPNTYTYDPAYFTFDLPFDKNDHFIIIKEDVDTHTPVDTDSYYQPIFSSADILVPYVNYIKNGALVNLHLVNDPNGDESAYIENGEFYINMAKADVTDLFHEIGHGILATIKDKAPEQYYRMLNTVTESPRFQEIAKYYPNKHGSDLHEEVLLKLMQMEMRGYQYSDIDLGLDNQIIVTTLNDFVKQFVDKPNNESYTFATAIQEITREIVDTIATSRKESIDKNLILLAQKAATIKNMLVTDKLLTQDCPK